MKTTKRVNNKKNKRNKKKNSKKNQQQQQQQQQNSSSSVSTTTSTINNNSNNEIRSNTSLKDYYPILFYILNELDIIYVDSVLSLQSIFNEIFKQIFRDVYIRRNPNPEYVLEDKKIAETFNESSQYWDYSGRTCSYGNNFNRMYYNERQLQNRKAIYPFSFGELALLYRKYNVYTEVVLMISELLPSKLEFSRHVLFGRVIKSINLGPLKSEIEIPLKLPVEDFLNRYTFFITIV
eukprot:jgi/Orpsp1_1/1177966/evm.model.c7180000063576.1